MSRPPDQSEETHAADRRSLLQLARQGLSIVSRATDQPLRVVVMGQTGVGKSSLINALFGTDLPTDPVRPCTKEPAVVDAAHVTSGHPLSFIDMPGLGEGDDQDERYLQDYRAHLQSADVVLWALHADSRAVASEQRWLRLLVQDEPADHASSLLSKIAFVLTRADLLHPQPWIAKIEDDLQSAWFFPQELTEHLLAEKCEYFYANLVAPYSDLIVAETHNDLSAGESLPPNCGLEVDEYTIRMRVKSAEALLRRAGDSPTLKRVVERLLSSSRPVACSAVYKYNLGQVLMLVLGRLEGLAIRRFRQHADTSTLDRLPVKAALEQCNILVLDTARERVYDLREFVEREVQKQSQAAQEAPECPRPISTD